MTSDPYVAFAEVYDRYKAAEDYRRVAELVLLEARRLGCFPHGAIDAATGTGNLALALSAHGLDVIGIDISDAMLTSAHTKQTPTCVFRKGDLRSMPVSDGCTDLVTCWNDSVNYLDDEEALARAIGEFARVLRPGGVVVLDANTVFLYAKIATDAVSYGTPLGHFYLRPLYRQARAGARHSFAIELDPPSKGDPPVVFATHHQTHYPVDLIVNALHEAGFRTVGVRGIRHRRFVDARDETSFDKLVFVAQK